jgi:hypothetical protein
MSIRMNRTREAGVTLHDGSGDGFHELTLEIEGKHQAVRVVNDAASVDRALRDFQAIIREWEEAG